MRIRHPSGCLVMLCAVLLTGCSRDSDVERYGLTGKVTHRGAPVPAGTIYFRPDEAAGNSGPASVATIDQGEYHLEAAQGIVGGEYRVKVQAFDGNAQAIPGESTTTRGAPLFPEKSLLIEFPQTYAEHDFEL